MNKLGKAAVVLGGLLILVVFFMIPTMIALKSFAIWHVYGGYVDAIADLTGLNRYLVTAGALVMFVPFYIGASMLFSVRALVSRWRRYTGVGILLALAVLYNLGLYYATKEMAFAFAGGAAQKWYAVTPDGVKLFDRPGVEPAYGIVLKPVTPDVIRSLRLLQKGEFKPIDPRRAVFFNPNTGEAQVWYYQYPDGAFEFYDKPGFHPITGTPLTAVTKDVLFQWQAREKTKQPPVPVPATSGSGGAGPSAIPVPGRTGDPAAPGAIVVEVDSDPSGAEVFLDWAPKGRTPIRLQFEGKRATGLLLLVKDGHQAGVRALDYGESASLTVTLPADRQHPWSRLLLLADPSVGAAYTALRGRLVEEGFSVLGKDEAREFQRELSRAGGLSNRGFRAWARVRFSTDRVLMAKLTRSSRELSKQELGYLGIQEAVKGAARAEVTVELEALDLVSGDALAAVSAKGAGIALDLGQGFEKATTQAVTESAKRLKQRLAG